MTLPARLTSRASRSGKLWPLLLCLSACEGQLVEYPRDAAGPPDAPTRTSQVEVVERRARTQRVDAPDYSLDASTLRLRADFGDVVQSATGNARLIDGSVTGQRYVVLDAAALNTYAKLDAAFRAAVQSPLTPDIPAAAFTLQHVDLTTPQTRTLIVDNSSEGVRAYQAFEVTFHPAR